jgi:hypothetical protein
VWVTHRYIGVDRVLLHDNNEDGGKQAAELSDFIRDGFLSFFTVQGEKQQIPVYQYCVTQSGQQFSWVAALDIDEFIVVEDARARQRPPSSRLKTVLQDFRFQPGTVLMVGPLAHNNCDSIVFDAEDTSFVRNIRQGCVVLLTTSPSGSTTRQCNECAALWSDPASTVAAGVHVRECALFACL